MVKRNRKFVLVGVALIPLVQSVTGFLLARDSYRPLETIATKTPLPGDVSWCDWGSENEILVQRKDEPSINGNNQAGTVEIPLDMDIPRLLGFAQNGAEVIVDLDYLDADLRKVAVAQYRYGTRQKIHQDTIVFPSACRVSNVEMNPRRDRMLRQLEVDLNQSRPTWLRSMMRFLHRPYKSRQASLFWICELDGQNGKMVGYVEDNSVQSRDATPANMRWLPSGTRISFTRGQSIWVVPIP
ncbi:MAG: hypothetical protein JWN14_2127 [Chthonomonadales bacterium]|nr:hypothetical protein [Chthonomonadales bacterium]